MTIAGLAVVLILKCVAVVAAAPGVTPLSQELARAATVAARSVDMRVITTALAASQENPPAERAAAAPPLTNQARTPAGASPAADVKGAPRSDLDTRERLLDQRELALAVAAKRLDERLAELAALQSRLQALDTRLKERDEANWSGLVKMYESMRPHEAAAIFNSLDKATALELLDRMKPAKAALLLAGMEAAKARQLTVDLATRRTQSTVASN
jgi:flagellar motility protein MotE (MotC chaperone)